MRKIEIELIAAIQAGRAFNKANTKIVKNEFTGGYDVYLYNSKIASYKLNNNVLQFIEICFDGYVTNTTKSRINAVLNALLPSANIFTFFKKGEVFISYDGDIKKVHSWNSYFIDMDRV